MLASLTRSLHILWHLIDLLTDANIINYFYYASHHFNNKKCGGKKLKLTRIKCIATLATMKHQTFISGARLIFCVWWHKGNFSRVNISILNESHTNTTHTANARWNTANRRKIWKFRWNFNPTHFQWLRKLVSKIYNPNLFTISECMVTIINWISHIARCVHPFYLVESTLQPPLWLLHGPLAGEKLPEYNSKKFVMHGNTIALGNDLCREPVLIGLVYKSFY